MELSHQSSILAAQQVTKTDHVLWCGTVLIPQCSQPRILGGAGAAQHSPPFPILPGRSSLAGAGEAAASVLFQSMQELQNPWKIEILDSQKQTSPFPSCLKPKVDAGVGPITHPFPHPSDSRTWSSPAVPGTPCPFRAQAAVALSGTESPAVRAGLQSCQGI